MPNQSMLERVETPAQINFVRGIGSFAISDADRLGVFTPYGRTRCPWGRER